jgi:hypothetical protein
VAVTALLLGWSYLLASIGGELRGTCSIHCLIAVLCFLTSKFLVLCSHELHCLIDMYRVFQSHLCLPFAQPDSSWRGFDQVPCTRLAACWCLLAGAVSLSTVMHMLQEAHAALQAPQSPQQLLQEHEQAQAQTPQQQSPGQQLRTRQQLRRAQPQQGQQQTAASCTPGSSASARHGWSKLAAVVWAAERRRPRSWITQQWASLAADCQHILRRMAAYAPAGMATHLTAGVNTHHPHTSTAAAAGNAAGPVAPQAAAANTGQPYLLQLVVQHLLGLLVALNLLLHRQVVLDAVVAAGAWLQEDVLKPHTTWLSQAHPGELGS